MRFGGKNGGPAGSAAGLARLAACLAAATSIVATGAGRARAAGQPGDLVAQVPLAGAPAGAQAWRIRYRSLDEKSKPLEITGIVIVPAGEPPAKGRDVIAWGRGTVGLAPVCAPSKTPKTMFEKTPGIAEMLERGWVIAASDFADPDSARPHPYLVGLAEAHAMLDIVRAARRMPEAKAGPRFAMWGESEGAHAALWSAKLAPTYAPGPQLVSVAVAAPPTDLVTDFDSIKNPGTRALMTGYASESWSQVYNIPLSTFANAFGRFLIHRLAKDCTRFDIPSAFVNTTLLILARQVPRNLGDPWNKRSAENSVRPWHMPVPLLIAQGSQDDVVMESITRDFAEGSCKLGTSVRYILDAKAGHLDIAAASAQATVDWLAARFAGQPAESDCAKLIGQAAGGETPSTVR